jgi:hypothetical protein
LEDLPHLDAASVPAWISSVGRSIPRQPIPTPHRRRRLRFGLSPTPSRRRLAWPQWSPQLPCPPGALGESPRRIGVPCDTTAEQEKGRLRLTRLTPATLTAAPLSIRLRGECIADISQDFTPPCPRFAAPLLPLPPPTSRARRPQPAAAVRRGTSPGSRGGGGGCTGRGIAGIPPAVSSRGPLADWTFAETGLCL